MEIRDFEIPQVTEQTEVERITGALNAIRGVRDVQGHAATKIFAVSWETPASWDDIEDTLTRMGYVPKWK